MNKEERYAAAIESWLATKLALLAEYADAPMWSARRLLAIVGVDRATTVDIDGIAHAPDDNGDLIVDAPFLTLISPAHLQILADPDMPDAQLAKLLRKAADRIEQATEIPPETAH